MMPADPSLPPISRRQTIRGLAAAASLPALAAGKALAAEGLHIATNTYPWSTFAKRAGEAFEIHSDALLARIASTGITGYEPAINNPAEFTGLRERLDRHGLEMRSLYVNSLLHEPEAAEKSLTDVMAIATAAKALGTLIIVTNPSPIRWGGPENKTDAQLRTQAAALDRLGAALRQAGLTLAYHNHDIELRHGAREFHHMLTATDPENVKFCLDAHWVYRGCGDSQVALFDTLALHGNRIVELHLRQSAGGVWTEAFTLDGDIDYARLFAWLKERDLHPHLVLEQAVETGSPQQLDAVAAHRLSREHLAAAL